jgi:GntR family transcriptional regulator, transcriptional repressor for pyruvate dehydrogenase complex
MSLPVEPPLRAMARQGGRRVRLPRMAEMVASRLRDQILSGELTVVPRLEDLIVQFDVGPPAAREAMRILETEGLITVRRGNVGGAEVHLPTADRVAYMVGLVLQSRAAELGDVGAALRQVEPLCAALCAQREDRAETVVPELRRILEEQAEAIGDVPGTLSIVDRFHETIVRGSGNETMIVVVGALERVWAAHAGAVYDRADVEPPELTVWKASLREHEKIVAAIERGDPKTADLARRHLEATHAYMSGVDDNRMVTASTVPRSS